jgi:uncharacterized protein YuzE
MKEFRAYYDEVDDILYLGRAGREEEVVEVLPGLNLEMDASGEIIGIELLRASSLLREILEPISRKALSA